jgi:hypothetical protein
MFSLSKLEFVVNDLGIPFYARELYYTAPDWAKEQMRACIPELENYDEETRKSLAGHFWVFRKEMEPHIFENAHDEIINCYKKGKEVFSVRIGVSRTRSFVKTQSLRGVSKTFNGGNIFHPDRDYDIISAAGLSSTSSVITLLRLLDKD